MHNKTLGDVIREARVGKGFSLRDLAKKLDKSPSYLSDIENDRRIPSEGVLRDIGTLLDLEFDRLMALAGRVGERAERYLKRYPAAGLLFRRISESNLAEEELEKLLEAAERLSKRRKGGVG